MTYPFVAARYDYGIRKGPALGLCIHMAEGGNTVRYLAGKPERGVSVHFVCEYSGRIVQMLQLDHASGSMNPAITRTDEGPTPYGRSVLDAVLGSWATDPNSAVISIEIEGFAKDGPKPAQVETLMEWAADMRSKIPELRGAIGHRDQQNQKPCPGAHIDWGSLGGHGLWHTSGPNVSTGGDMSIQATGGLTSDYVLDLPKGASIYSDAELSQKLMVTTSALTVMYVGASIGEAVTGGSRAILVPPGWISGGKAPGVVVYISTSAAAPYVPKEPPAPTDDTPYSQADLDQATANGKAVGFEDFHDQLVTFAAGAKPTK